MAVAGRAPHVVAGGGDALVVFQRAFEHPGLLKPPAEDCADDVCVTCSDEGRLAEVILEPADPLGRALVRTAKGEEWVDVSVLGDVVPNDLVLVHAGTAITRLDDAREVNR